MTIGVIVGSFCIALLFKHVHCKAVKFFIHHFVFEYCLSHNSSVFLCYHYDTSYNCVVEENALDSLGCEHKLSLQHFLRYSGMAGESALSQITIYEVQYMMFEVFEDWVCIAKTMNHFTEQLKYFNSALQCFPRKSMHCSIKTGL